MFYLLVSTRCLVFFVPAFKNAFCLLFVVAASDWISTAMTCALTHPRAHALASLLIVGTKDRLIQSENTKPLITATVV